MIAAWWRLARPAGLPFVAMLPWLGFGFAHWDRALALRDPAGFALVFAAWALLHAGTMWCNAALDRDEGELLLGKPAPVPPGTWWLGVAALCAAVVVAARCGAATAGCAVGCALLALAYSKPVSPWKAHPVLGPLTNAVGYGVLSPAAGWALAGVPADARTWAAWALVSPLTLGAYFAAQAFQREEDAARGYRTLVVTGGPEAALRAARLGFGVGFGGVAWLATAGWFPRLALVAIPAWLWLDAYLRRWQAIPGGGDARWAGGAALRVWLAGLAVLAAVATQYALDSLAGGPVAGLATVAGVP